MGEDQSIDVAGNETTSIGKNRSTSVRDNETLEAGKAIPNFSRRSDCAEDRLGDDHHAEEW